jgi:hypothetical protein
MVKKTRTSQLKTKTFEVKKNLKGHSNLESALRTSLKPLWTWWLKKRASRLKKNFKGQKKPEEISGLLTSVNGGYT